MSLVLASPAFASGAPIPSEHARRGGNLSPPLRWQGAPAQARSLALVVEDTDVPAGPHRTTTWVHWVVYDLRGPAAGGMVDGSIPAGASPGGLPAGASEGLNGWKMPGWAGPAPPDGRHRYVFRLLALDRALGRRGPLAWDELWPILEGGVLEEARLVGLFGPRDLRRG